MKQNNISAARIRAQTMTTTYTRQDIFDYFIAAGSLYERTVCAHVLDMTHGTALHAAIMQHLEECNSA